MSTLSSKSSILSIPRSTVTTSYVLPVVDPKPRKKTTKRKVPEQTPSSSEEKINMNSISIVELQSMIDNSVNNAIKRLKCIDLTTQDNSTGNHTQQSNVAQHYDVAQFDTRQPDITYITSYEDRPFIDLRIPQDHVPITVFKTVPYVPRSAEEIAAIDAEYRRKELAARLEEEKKYTKFTGVVGCIDYKVTSQTDNLMLEYYIDQSIAGVERPRDRVKISITLFDVSIIHTSLGKTRCYRLTYPTATNYMNFLAGRLRWQPEQPDAIIDKVSNYVPDTHISVFKPLTMCSVLMKTFNSKMLQSTSIAGFTNVEWEENMIGSASAKFNF